VPGRTVTASALLALAIGLVSSTALGQPPSDAVLARAREHFERGVAAVQRNEWSVALGAFEESYRLAGRGSSLYNIATTLRAMGRHAAARDAFDRLLTEHDDLDPEMQANAESLRAEEAARIATLVLQDVPPAEEAAVRVDGESIAEDHGDTVELDLDAGSHYVEAIDFEDGASFRWEGELAGGARTVVEISLSGGEGGGFWSGPVPWIALGAVIVAGAVLGGFLYYDSLQPEPGSSMCIDASPGACP
jgi:hypothetical protein